MLSKIVGTKAVNNLFLGGYCLLALGLPFNKIVLSLSTMFVVLLTLLDIDLKRDFHRIKSNKMLQLLLLLLLVHLSSLFWTENTAYFLKDFNNKLTLYLLPCVLVLHPILSAKHLRLILYFFITSVTLVSIYNFSRFFFWDKHSELDLREMSVFVSHIRFGLMIVFALISCIYLIVKDSTKKNSLLFVVICWLLIYTYIAEVFNAYLALFFLILVSGCWILFKTYSRKKAMILSSMIVLLLAVSCFAVYHFALKSPPEIQISKLDRFSKGGHAYTHYPKSRHYINGNHVYSYICIQELHDEWQKIAPVSLYDTNKLGYQHYYTLLHYMSSMGLRKDAEGLKKLSEQDLQNILNGKKDVDEQSSGFFRRLETLRNEFYDDDPNGKTIKQRVEFVKTGWQIFIRSPFIGIGSGDVQDAFDEQYIQNKSKLKPENRLRSHNQFLTYFISFGILGGLIFVLLICYTLFHFIKKSDWLATLFMCLLVFSFLSEDTLETQMGVTFFALFFGIFIGMKSTPIHQHES